MLKQIGDRLWIVKQPQKYYGLEVGTRMSIVVLDNNDIALISPVTLDPTTIDQINNLGKVKYLISPNLFHYLYLTACQKIYPEAITITPPGLLAKKPDIQSDLILIQDVIEFDQQLEYFLFSGFAVPLPTGVKELNEIVFFHPASKTLIITDIAFYFDNSFPWLTQLIARILGCYEKLRPSILEKLVIQDKIAVKDSIERILSWDFEQVVMAHGTIIKNEAKQQLKAGYEWFLGCQL